MSSSSYSEDYDGSHEPLNEVAALLDCARYNDANDEETIRKYLQTHSSSVDVADDQGRTAMHMAAANNHTSIMNLLFGFTPQPDRCNAEGNTALHFAALNNALRAAKLLLWHGWSADQANRFGKTPLQLIYNKNFTEMEMLLTEHDKSMDINKMPSSADSGEQHDDDHDDDDDTGEGDVAAAVMSDQSQPLQHQLLQSTCCASDQGSLNNGVAVPQVATSFDDVE